MPVNATEVLVARRDIQLGEVTKETDFRWQTWPADAVTPSFITQADGDEGMKLVTDAIARAPLLEGEPVTRQKLIKPGQGGVLAAILPSGMRAISTRIKEETAAGRLILPNDRVDVILTRRVRSQAGQDEFVADTLVLQRARPRHRPGDRRQGRHASLRRARANTATLELTPAAGGAAGARQFDGRDQPVAAQHRRRRPEGKGPTAAMNDQRGSAVRVLRYGVPIACVRRELSCVIQFRLSKR